MIEDGDFPTMEGAGARARPQRRWLLPLTLVLLAFIAGIGLAAYAVRYDDRVGELVRPTPPAPIPPQPIVERVTPPAPPSTPELAGRVDRIEAQIAGIETRAEEASGDADRAEGLLVAFAARRALDRGRPMGFLEPQLRAHFGATEPQAVAMVIGAGQRPVTLIQLQRRFAEIAPAFQRAPASEGWWTATRRELGSLFVIRRAEEVRSQPADRIERAQRALDLGQVDVALDEVARLPGAQGAADWMSEARRYVLARNALDRIETAALLAPEGRDRPNAPPARD